jgi:hypothetical protein
MNLPINGMRIIESAYLEEDGEPYQVRRTWRERLFTRPWRPLVATRTVVPKVPFRGVIQLNATTLVMHPVTLRQLRETLGNPLP